MAESSAVFLPSWKQEESPRFPPARLHGYTYIEGIYLDICTFFAPVEYKNSLIVALITGSTLFAFGRRELKQNVGDDFFTVSLKDSHNSLKKIIT